MKKLYILGLIALAATIIGLAWAEQMTFSTYYPAPYGVYNEMRARKMAIGGNYLDNSSVTLADDNLIVEGNVGIGTASPISDLHIYDSDDFTYLYLDSGDDASQVAINFITEGTPTQEALNTNPNVKAWHFVAKGDQMSAPNIPHTFNMSYWDGSDFTETLTLTPGGNVGIGIANPNARLHLKIPASDNTTRPFHLEKGTDSLVWIANNGNLYVDNGLIYGSLASDERMKKNIRPLSPETSLLEKVMQLQSVSFEWKHRKDKKRFLGLIAQDVEEVIPEVVSTSRSPSGNKGFIINGLNAVLVEAIKELKAEKDAQIEQLKAEIAALKAK